MSSEFKNSSSWLLDASEFNSDSSSEYLPDLNASTLRFLYEASMHHEDEDSSQDDQETHATQFSTLSRCRNVLHSLLQSDSKFAYHTILNVAESSADDSRFEEACDSQSKIRDEFMTRLGYFLKESDFEFGYSTPADRYVEEALRKYGTFAREWMNEMFIDAYSKPSAACGILRVIAHFEYKQIYPQGVTMAVAALRHKDPLVRECGIRCFENWEEPSSLPVLRNLEIDEPWLREYWSNVIADLEGVSEYVAPC